MTLSDFKLLSNVSYDELSGVVNVLPCVSCSVDFLSDNRRSTIFYIDMVSTCTDFVFNVSKNLMEYMVYRYFHLI